MAEFEEDMTLSKGSFGNKSEHFDSPKGIEEQEPEQNRMQMEMSEQIPSPKSHADEAQNQSEYSDFNAKLNAFESNTSLNLSTNLKAAREQLFITSRRLQDQKMQYETFLADRARCVESLEYELQKGDQEKEQLKRRVNDLNFEHENTRKSLEKKLEEASIKLSEYEKDRIKIILTQNELTRVQMENDLLKVNSENFRHEMDRLKQEKSRLENENQGLQNIIKENRDMSQGNQSLMLNLGIPAYKSQLYSSIEDFSALGINLDSFNLDKHSVYELCNLLMRGSKDLNTKVKYYVENQFEEKLALATEENLKMKEDIRVLEKLKDDLIELNQTLQVRNHELSERQFDMERLNQVRAQKDEEIALKNDTIIKKDRIIVELERMIEIYESQIYTKEHLKGSGQMEEELEGSESKESILNSYNKLKQEWTLLMKDYKDLRQAIIEYQQKDPNNADKYEENFLNSLIRENNHLKEENKLREEECKRYFEHAVEKVQQFKDITKTLLGWDIRIKDEIVEMRSLLSSREEDVLVLREIEEKKYDILDIEDFAKDLFTNYPHLTELKDNSYPLFFAYVTGLMKPELKDLFFIF